VSKCVNKCSLFCETLQKYSDVLYTWSEINRLSLNKSECYVVTFSKQEQHNNNYSVEGTHLTRLDICKDMEVIVDSKFYFTNHRVNSVSNLSHKMCGFVFRNCRAYVALHDFLHDTCSIFWICDDTALLSRFNSAKHLFKFKTSNLYNEISLSSG
jgi:hypothetical protein